MMQILYSLSLALKHSGSSESPRDYALSSLASSLAAASAFSLVAIAFNAGIELIAAAFLVSFAGLLAFFYALAFRRAWLRGQELEAEMVFGLKQIAVCLDSGISFERCVEAASRGGGAFSRELASALRQVNSGASLRAALAGIGERTNSQLVRRAVLQLMNCYDAGGSQGLRKLADEATALQLARSREFGGRQAFYGVFFISASAVLPAAFAAFATVGSAFLGFETSPLAALSAFALAFPLLDALLLSLLYLQAPHSVIQ